MTSIFVVFFLPGLKVYKIVNMSWWSRIRGYEAQNDSLGLIKDELTLRKHDQIFKLERKVELFNPGKL